MEPIDKFERHIYSNTFDIMLNYGKILIENGYTESFKKPNLFYKTIPEGCLFANMQGTDIVAIWDDPHPAFHWQFNEDVPLWKRRRIIKEEAIRLFKAKCPVRFHFYMHETEEFLNTGAGIDEKQGIYEWDDGYCDECEKDFQDEGSYCSKECEKKAHIKGLNKCELCKKPIEYKDQVEHHISYYPEKTTWLHRGCHNIINKTDKYPELKQYTEEEKKKFYKT